jgi:hypothetical protein
MASQLQLRRGTTPQHAVFVGAPGEVTVDTDKKTTVVHDGTTMGGFPLAKESVTATGSTTPRLIANRFADIVNVRDFGAVGDGVANDSTAIQAALNHALTKTTSALYVPAGTYLLNARLTGALISDQRLRIYGDGMYASLLLVNNVNGGISLTGQRNAEFEMDSIWLAPNLDGAGTAFEHIVPSGGSQIARICQLTNVSMVPQVTNVALSWNRGIVIQGLFRPRLDNVIVGQGASSIKMTDICNLDQCY